MIVIIVGTLLNMTSWVAGEIQRPLYVVVGSNQAGWPEKFIGHYM